MFDASALALTPPLGWNSWNAFGPYINEQIVRETADALVEHGLQALGYEYVVIDDHWHGDRDAQGVLHESQDKFPSGMKALADYIHHKGLKFGIYSCAGSQTCGGEPGSYGYETQDAQRFADWDVDLLKYDYCYAPSDLEARIQRYTAMNRAMQATGSPILFSICEWGEAAPWTWARQAGGQMWRVSPDVLDQWDIPKDKQGYGIVNAIDRMVDLAPFSAPGGWNDLDMLVVGLQGQGQIDGAGCTAIEYRSQMTMWSMFASPLMIGCDLRSMDKTTYEILANPALIAINQDRLGQQAIRVVQAEFDEIWQKPLVDGELAIALFNRGDTAATLTATAADLSLDPTVAYRIYDVWTHEDRGEFKDQVSLQVAPHGCECLRLVSEYAGGNQDSSPWSKRC